MNRFRSFGKCLWKAALISMWLPICLSAGCGSRATTYVNSDHRLTKLKEGEAAPRSGVLINEGYLAEIYEALGRPKPAVAEAAKASTNTPAGPNAGILEKK